MRLLATAAVLLLSIGTAHSTDIISAMQYEIEQNTQSIMDLSDVVDENQQFHLNLADTLANSIITLEEDMSAGIALGIATGSHFFDVGYEGTQASVAVGGFHGEGALSVAIGTRVEDDVFGNLSFGVTSQGHAGIGAGLSFRF